MSKKTEMEVLTGEVENTTSTALVTEDIASVDLIAQLKNPDGAFYCSIADDGKRATKVAIYNAVNNAQESLDEHIGEELSVVDVVAYPVQLVDENTGEIVNALRTILIDKDRNSYSAVSQGVTNSLSRIFSIVGEPSWKDEPLKLKAKKVATRNGSNKVTICELIG